MDNRLTPLTTYPGGKNSDGVWQQLINLMPPHSIYIEAFLGSGAVMRRKKPAKVNIGIEINAGVCDRWRRHNADICRVIETDAVQWLDAGCDAFGPDALLYLDPPYLSQVRRSSRPIYDNEFGTIFEHSQLLSIVRRQHCLVIISGYDCGLYRDILKGWRRVDFPGRSHRGGTTESVWLNFPEPDELHDYRYIGNDRRQRIDARRRRQRWLRQLERMTPQLRNAMLEQIRERFPSGDAIPAVLPYQMQGPVTENAAAGPTAPANGIPRETKTRQILTASIPSRTGKP